MAVNLLLIAAFVAVMILMSYNFAKKKKKILFAGDSITELGVQPGGYISLLKDKLHAAGLDDKISLISSGRSGDKVNDLLSRLEREVILHEPNVVFVFIGVNDIWHKNELTAEENFAQFQQSYTALIEMLASKNLRVVVCTIGLIGEKTDFTNELDAELEKYSECIRTIASTHNLQLADVRNLFVSYNLQHNVNNAADGVVTLDGVHLNETGNQLLANHFWNIVEHIKY